MCVEVARDRLPPLAHGVRVACDHRDGPEDVQPLPLRQTQPEVGAIQVGGAGLQQVDVRTEGDERVLLPFDAGRDVEAGQERLRVAAEFVDEFPESPQRLEAIRLPIRSTPPRVANR